MTLLELITSVFKRAGMTAPVTVIGNTDDNIIRVVALANEEGEHLASRHAWQALTREATHTTLAAESQGLITTICGTDFDYIKNETFWNRTKNRPWFPVDDVKWQRMKSTGITGPVEYFRVRGDELIVTPIPTADETLAFEWVSFNWCEDNAGTGQDEWGADDDVSRLPAKLFKAGLLWRWKQAQGLEYAEDFNKYEHMIADAMARDGANPVVNMGSTRSRSTNIPDGNWDL